MKSIWKYGLSLRDALSHSHALPSGHNDATIRQASRLYSCWASLGPRARYGSRRDYLKAKDTKRSTSSVAATAAAAAAAATRVRKPRAAVPEYHLTPSVRCDETGEIVWPAPKESIERARNFILECTAAKKKTLIVPDKDADGLTSGAILQRTLILLGLDPKLISAHVLSKGNNVHDEFERDAMAAHEPEYIFVLDQGSGRSPPVIDAPHKALVIDHHWACDDDAFPQGSEHVTACHSPPVATSSLLTYHICAPLHEGVPGMCDWLCAMGTHGDLGTSLKWEPPFPDMKSTFKMYTRKAINQAVSLINAPRRTATYDVPGAWAALTAARVPSDLHNNDRLLADRAEVNAEVKRCARVPPRFSSDGRIAVFRIDSAAQVQNVIAMRWAGTLQSPELEAILVGNEGYLPGLVNFSCRVPRSAMTRDPPVDLIKVLEGVAEKSSSPSLRARLGQSFARGHKQASGGVVPKAEFEELINILKVRRQSGSDSMPSMETSKESVSPKMSITG